MSDDQQPIQPVDVKLYALPHPVFPYTHYRVVNDRPVFVSVQEYQQLPAPITDSISEGLVKAQTDGSFLLALFRLDSQDGKVYSHFQQAAFPAVDVDACLKKLADWAQPATGQPEPKLHEPEPPKIVGAVEGELEPKGPGGPPKLGDLVQQMLNEGDQ